ncbi:YesL family protein [Salisediminibacterium beveridgei]|uniref:Membrane protein YesL n=1 Tax=Salisediminibacterium beveridgei TaxID=632773 RepID=A0A1D7QZ89_9BACI|nr:DUF624 domain-containing protein [Salisediminibacterium beveridgei]AOM84326.1 hypothetical protein BBEV_3006 [Salisediminibacterium beveridgei]
MIVSKLEEAFRFISRFALLNLTWLGYTLIGAVILGLFPSTVALFTMVHRWISQDAESPIIKPFHQTFKSYFWKANLVGWLFTGIGALLYLNYHLISSSEGAVPLPVTISFLLIIVIYTLLIVSLFPVWAYYKGGVKNAILQSFRFVFGRVHVAISFAMIVWASLYLSLAFPAFIIFFTGSLLAYILMWFFNRTIYKLQLKANLL